jgi:hypothetical protein
MVTYHYVNFYVSIIIQLMYKFYVSIIIQLMYKFYVSVCLNNGVQHRVCCIIVKSPKQSLGDLLFLLRLLLLLVLFLFFAL